MAARRGPSDKDLAVAVYHGATVVKRYSTLDIASAAPAGAKGYMQSVSHYDVLEGAPELGYSTAGDGGWVVRMTTVDGAGSGAGSGDGGDAAGPAPRVRPGRS